MNGNKQESKNAQRVC